MRKTSATLKQFRYLVALADMGHFRHAAEYCGVSQPSLSVQLQNLEEVLGARLVERGRSGVFFTPIGREVVTRARHILMETQSLVDFIEVAEHGMTGTIRLGVKATLGPYLLPRVVASLHQKHTDMKIYIREGIPHKLEDELTSGLHDVILAQLPIRTSNLVTERLFREPILLAVSSDNPLARQKSVSTMELKGLPVLSLSPDYHLHDQVHTLCNDFGAVVMRDYEGTSLDALRQMVAMNIGVTFLPALYAQSEVSKLGDVVALPLTGRSISRSIGLVWRKGAGRSSIYQELADFIRETIKRDFKILVLE
ncbi:MAG: hydrogen peroxide-inducible genes activator [Amylibacter sp.]|nr:hydrogen peroxide-inducible genes activator [Amylibacter sp.]